MTNRARTIVIALAVLGICVLSVVAFLAGAAVMGYRAAMRAGYEAATLQNLKTIAAVEVQYFNTHNQTFGTIDQLIKEHMLSSKFTGDSTIADGYVLTLSLARKPDNSSSWYKLTADPEDNARGRNHFYLDSDDGRIRVNSDRQAGPADPLQ